MEFLRNRMLKEFYAYMQSETPNQLAKHLSEIGLIKVQEIQPANHTISALNAFMKSMFQ